MKLSDGTTLGYRLGSKSGEQGTAADPTIDVFSPYGKQYTIHSEKEEKLGEY